VSAPEPLWFSRDAVRRVDQLAVERYAIPSIVLMENAARALASAALEMLPMTNPVACVCCGPGNNGGDGFALARHLHNAGVDVLVIAMRELNDYDGDAAVNATIIERMEINATVAREGDASLPDHADLLVDALLGTGLTDAPRGVAAELIDAINEHAAPALAVDIPSGLDADTGEALGAAVRAARTVSFVGMKRGFANPKAAEFTGTTTIGDIGAPRELARELGEPAPAKR
jgi:NAD(P)H-hydrate epimerase